MRDGVYSFNVMSGAAIEGIALVNGNRIRGLNWNNAYPRPKDWPVEPRPPDPPYIDLLVAFRNGNRQAREDFFVSAILRVKNNCNSGQFLFIGGCGGSG